MTVQLVSPVPAWWYRPLVWAWLRERPDLNFDDHGPQTVAEFEVEMQRRVDAGERTWGVYADGAPCGLIGYLPITATVGSFHGICFTEPVHGTGVPQAAVRRVLGELYLSGVEKVSASFFATNVRVHRFFLGLGATDEGVLRAQTRQHGRPMDLRLMALFALAALETPMERRG
mgnify:FL=1